MTKRHKNFFLNFIIKIYNLLKQVISCFLKVFVKSSHHANIAKKLEERNLNIYSTVMVGMAWQYYDTWALIPLPVYLVSEKKKRYCYSLCRHKIQCEKTLLNWGKILQTSNRKWWYVCIMILYIFGKNNLIKRVWMNVLLAYLFTGTHFSKIQW